MASIEALLQPRIFRPALISLLILAFCAAVARAFWLILSAPAPLGINSFYIMLELRERLQTGAGYYTRWSLFFWFFSAVQRLAGCSPENTLKIIQVVTLILLTLGLLSAARERVGFRITSVASPLILLLSPALLEITLHHLRQSFSLGLVFCGWAALRSLPSKAQAGRPLSARRLAGLVLFLLGAISHMFGAACALLLLQEPGASKLGRTAKIWAGVFLAAVLAAFLAASPKDFSPAPSLSQGPLFLFAYCDACDCSRQRFTELAALVTGGLLLLVTHAFLSPRRMLRAPPIYWLIFLAMNLPVWTLDSAPRLFESSFWIFLAGLVLSSESENRVGRGVAKGIGSALVLLLMGLYPQAAMKSLYTPWPPAPSSEEKGFVQRFIAAENTVLAPPGLYYWFTYHYSRPGVRDAPENEARAGYRLSLCHGDCGPEAGCVASTMLPLAGDNQMPRCVSFGSTYKIEHLQARPEGKGQTPLPTRPEPA